MLGQTRAAAAALSYCPIASASPPSPTKAQTERSTPPHKLCYRHSVSDLDHLRALRAFEAAARKLSYVDAARELHVTPAAIGQQVRALETWAGVALFHRTKAGTARLSLTKEAHFLLPELSGGFDRIAEAVRRLRQGASRPAVTVALTPAFAAGWLLPRLDLFRAEHPDIDLRLDIADAPTNYARAGIDIGVRFGPGHWPGLTALLLRSEQVVPVCAPALANGTRPLRAVADLGHHTLIQDTTVAIAAGVPDWRAWLDRADHPGLAAASELRVNASAAAIQAAIAGQGIVLARTLLVADDIIAGRLVCPFDDPPWPLRWAWYVVRPIERTSLQTDAFLAWLLTQART